jgi:hypothetical protein
MAAAAVAAAGGDGAAGTAGTKGAEGSMGAMQRRSEFEDVWPLNLVDLRDPEQTGLVVRLLRTLPAAVRYYLAEEVFPPQMAHQGLKLAASGQELGGDLLFGRRLGFSGTPSELLPTELGQCHYDAGIDGELIHVLTDVRTASVRRVAKGWRVETILREVAAARPAHHCLVDTGALVTGMSNLQVARFLLEPVALGGGGLCLSMKGVVFLDERDRQMVLLRSGLRVLPLKASGLRWNERFTFYDQVRG